MKFASGTGDVTFQIIKVDVTPRTRAVVDQSDLCLLTIELYDIPGHPFHCLGALTGHSLLHLESESKSIRNAMKLILSLMGIVKPERGNIPEPPGTCRNTKNITRKKNG